MARKTVEVETTGQAYWNYSVNAVLTISSRNAGTDFAPLMMPLPALLSRANRRPNRLPCPTKTPRWRWRTGIHGHGQAASGHGARQRGTRTP